MISQGDVWWADLEPSEESVAAYPRPVVVVQSDTLNATGIRSVLCLPLTRNLAYAELNGNVLLKSDETGLPQDSVGVGPLLLAVGRSKLRGRVGALAPHAWHLVLAAIDATLGR